MICELHNILWRWFDWLSGDVHQDECEVDLRDAFSDVGFVVYLPLISFVAFSRRIINMYVGSDYVFKCKCGK